MPRKLRTADCLLLRRRKWNWSCLIAAVPLIVRRRKPKQNMGGRLEGANVYYGCSLMSRRSTHSTWRARAEVRVTSQYLNG
jgi:hypothetical protein